MRTAITVGYKHGGGAAVMVQVSDNKASAHAEHLKHLGLSTTHKEFCLVEVWESDGGIVMSRKFKPLEVVKSTSQASAEVTKPSRSETKK